ncbi:ABC transporter ATP-binding protein [Rhodospirillaceae bacterium SYSU D60014]|uniref:ABC transporter ATP-binding protein n=1 Tax=Virgifigura deserti TaxID=2268457 RepID=UPI000E66E501
MTAGAKTLVEIAGATKRFGPVTAVDVLSLDIRENEFFALLGPSGCGKTTLLRMIAGFEQPDVGRILLDGRDITAVRPNRRPINMMFQSYALFPHLSVYDNIAYGLEMEGVRGAALKQRVDEALAMVRLEEFGRRRPHLLSGGQRQRVALARALIKRPRLLLLDEPLAALDKKLRGQMQLELKRLQHDTGITFLVVTHDQEEALAMADRIALLEAGKIAQLGSPRALYERPASRFVADFIGVMNFFEGRLAALAGGRAEIEVDGLGRLWAETEDLDGAAVGGPVTLAVRPERVRLSVAPAGAAGQNALSGTVVGVAYLGQDLIVHIGLPGQPAPLVARLGSGSHIADDLVEGAAVRCDWPPNDSRILLV